MRYLKLPQNILFLDVVAPNDQIMVGSGDIRFSTLQPLMVDFYKHIDTIRDVLLFRDILSSGDLKIKDNILFYKKFHIPDEVAQHFFTREYSEEQLLILCNLWVSLYTRNDAEASIKVFQTAVGRKDIRPLTKDGLILGTSSFVDTHLFQILKSAGITLINFGEQIDFKGTLEDYFIEKFPKFGRPLSKEFITTLKSSERNTSFKWKTIENLQVIVETLELSFDETRKWFLEGQADILGQTQDIQVFLEFLKKFWSKKKICELLANTNQRNFFRDINTHLSVPAKFEYLQKYMEQAPKCADLEELSNWISLIVSRRELEGKVHLFSSVLMPWMYLLKKYPVTRTHQEDFYQFYVMETVQEMGHYGNILKHCLGSSRGQYTINAATSGTGVFGVVYKNEKPYMTGYWSLNDKKFSLNQFFGRNNAKGNDASFITESIADKFTYLLNGVMESLTNENNFEACWNAFTDLVDKKHTSVANQGTMSLNTQSKTFDYCPYFHTQALVTYYNLIFPKDAKLTFDIKQQFALKYIDKRLAENYLKATYDIYVNRNVTPMKGNIFQVKFPTNQVSFKDRHQDMQIGLENALKELIKDADLDAVSAKVSQSVAKLMYTEDEHFTVNILGEDICVKRDIFPDWGEA